MVGETSLQASTVLLDGKVLCGWLCSNGQYKSDDCFFPPVVVIITPWVVQLFLQVHKRQRYQPTPRNSTERGEKTWKGMEGLWFPSPSGRDGSSRHGWGFFIISSFLVVGTERLKCGDLMEAGHRQWPNTETSATLALSATSLSVGMLLTVSNKSSQSRMTQALDIFTVYWTRGLERGGLGLVLWFSSSHVWMWSLESELSRAGKISLIS